MEALAVDWAEYLPWRGAWQLTNAHNTTNTRTLRHNIVSSFNDLTLTFGGVFANGKRELKTNYNGISGFMARKLENESGCTTACKNNVKTIVHFFISQICYRFGVLSLRWNQGSFVQKMLPVGIIVLCFVPDRQRPFFSLWAHKQIIGD